MEFLLMLLQICFVLFVFGILLLFLFCLLLTWTWAQNNQDRETSFLELLTLTSIEWGSIVSLGFGQALGAKSLWDAPPLDAGKINPKQLPVIFVPSLHTGSGIFRIMVWRFSKHYFSSLWPFAWRPFLHTEELLEDQLLQFIQDIIQNTRAPEMRVISFGSSRPIVSRVLCHPRLADLKKTWISISAPKNLSATMKFLSTSRLRNSYQEGLLSPRDPDLSIRGTHDIFCYPENVWGPEKFSAISPIGHYATLLHPTTIQKCLDEFC